LLVISALLSLFIWLFRELPLQPFPPRPALHHLWLPQNMDRHRFSPPFSFSLNSSKPPPLLAPPVVSVGCFFFLFFSLFLRFAISCFLVFDNSTRFEYFAFGPPLLFSLLPPPEGFLRTYDRPSVTPRSKIFSPFLLPLLPRGYPPHWTVPWGASPGPYSRNGVLFMLLLERFCFCLLTLFPQLFVEPRSFTP